MSFQQGLSGLNAATKSLDAIGNNVANAGTVGFKLSQAQFSDMYQASLTGSGAAQIGTGVKLAGVVQQFTQGNVTVTGSAMDMAINGRGFFRTIDQNGSIAFSRNGQFQVDKDGFVVSNSGHKLTGYIPNAAGVILQGQPQPIQISAADMLPKQSTTITAGTNLDAKAAVPITTLFNPIDPTSFNNSTSLTVYDSLGSSHVGSLYFQRVSIDVATLTPATLAGNNMTLTSTTGLAIGNTLTVGGQTYTVTGVASPTTLTVTPAGAFGATAVTATNAGSPDWNVYLTVDGGIVSGPVIGAPIPPSTVIPPGNVLTQLRFDTLGKLILPVGPPVGNVISNLFTPPAAAGQTLTFDFGQSSQYGAQFGVNTLTQDGYTSGRLSGYNTSPEGVILGRYTNGQSRPLGQVILANFTDPQGLQPAGSNEWFESSASGAPLIGSPGSASLGMIQSSAVEDSNVDLTAELVNMITAQRIYQANAQTIKTQDQIMQTIVNLR
jgi:flagellar hook protein FlgE